MFSRLTLTQKGLIAVAFVLLSEIVFVGVLATRLKEAEVQIEEARRIQEILSHMNKISNLWQRSGNELGKFLEIADLGNLTATSYLSTAAAVRNHSRQMKAELAAVKELLKDRPSEARTLVELQRNTDNFLGSIERVQLGYQNKVATGGEQMYHTAIESLSTISDQCTHSSDVLLTRYQRLDEENHKQQAELRQQTTTFLYFGLALNTVLALIAAWWFVSSTVRRILIISENSVRLGAGKPLNPEQAGEDEIAQLDRAFHFMALQLDESLRKERAVIDNAIDMICSIDSNSRFVAVNPASFTVLGYRPEDLIGRRYLDLVVPEDLEAVRKTFDEIVMRPREAPIDIRILRRDGKVANMLWSVHWSEKDRAWFCVAHDVTEQRRVEQMKQDFMAMVGHDLRTPLNSVAGTLHMLIEGMYDIKTESGLSRVKAAESNVWRLVELVNDLMDIEKLAAGHLVMELNRVELGSIVKQASEMVSTVAEQSGVGLVSDVPDLAVNADEDRLVQVVVNLLSNAVKFSPAGSTVTIAGKELPDSCELRITDSGRGIPLEAQDTIFDRFKQVETADGKRHKGTGLGLAICKEIVTLHNGTIGVESQPGAGSTFWIRIPKAAI